MLRWLTAGESHGPALVALLDGVPAGVEVTSAEIGRDLARRRLGYGRGARMKFEQDVVEFIGGVRHGLTLGSPVAIRVGNSEWPKWETVMSADPVDPGELAAQARNAPLTRPRPGHADLAGMQKYGHTDARPILERASARETAARVAVGVVAKQLIKQALGIDIVSHVIELGSVSAKTGLVPTPDAPYDTVGAEAVEVGALARRVRAVLGRPELPIERPVFRPDDEPDRYVGEGRTFARLAAGAGLAPVDLDGQIRDTADDLRRRA